VDLVKLINDKVKDLDESGKIEESLDKHLESMIENIFKDIFSRYGKLVKQLTEGIEEKLNINLSNLDLPTYNEQMLVGIKTAMSSKFLDSASDRFKEELDKLFGEAPKTISVKEFVDTILNFWRADNYQNYDLMKVEIEENDYPLGGYKLTLSKDGSSYGSSDDVHLYIGEENKIRISHGHNYNPTCLFSEDAFIFKLYAAGTVITGLEEFDPDDIDVDYNQCDY
jgi:hypothetical protein